MNCRNAWAWSLAVASIAGVSVLTAAPPKVEQPGTKVLPGDSAVRPEDQRTGWRNNDHMLASCVAIDNQEEVAIAKFVADKTKNDDVKKFARMLVSNHSEFLKKLQQFAPEATRDGFLEESRAGNSQAGNTRNANPNAGQPSATTQTTAKPPLAGASQSGIDMLSLHRELAEQCLADAKAKLNEKDSDEFDECFVGFQIAKHAAMKAKLTVFERHASGELRDLFAAGLKTTSNHLDQAEKLMKKLADSSESTASK